MYMCMLIFAVLCKCMQSCDGSRGLLVARAPASLSECNKEGPTCYPSVSSCFSNVGLPECSTITLEEQIKTQLQHYCFLWAKSQQAMRYTQCTAPGPAVMSLSTESRLGGGDKGISTTLP